MLAISSTKLGLPGNKENQNGFEFHLKPEKIHKNRGETFIAVEFNLNKETSAKIADIIKTVFENEYYKDDPTRPSPVVSSIGPLFESAIYKVNKALATINNEGYAKLEDSFHIIIATIKNSEIHISHHGKVNAFLYRNTVLSNLVDTSNSHEGNAYFGQTVSGSLQNQDTVILTTHEFTNFISTEKINRTLGRGSGKKAAEEFQIILNEIDHDCPINGFFIDINKERTSSASVSIHNPASLPKKEPEPVQKNEEIIEEVENLPSLEIDESVVEKPKTKKFDITQYTKKISSLFSIKNKESIDQKYSDATYKSPEERAFEEKIKSKTKHLSSQNIVEPIKKDQNNNIIIRTINKIPPQKRRIVLIALIALISLITVISIIKTIQAKQLASSNENTEKILTKLSENEKEVASLVIQKDFENAETKLKKIEEEISNLTNEQKQTLEYKDLEKRINQDKEKIFKINRITPNLISRISQNTNLKQIFSSRENLFAISGSQIAIFKFNNDNKQFEELSEGSEGIKSIQFAEFNENKNTIAALYENGIAEMPLFSLKIEPSTTSLPKDNSNIKDFVVYEDKIYLLDIENNQIYRHLRTIDGYNEGKEWLQESIDLSDATSIAIDSNIYVLKKNGSIIKLTRGAVADFALDEVSEPISENSVIHTNEELDNIYVLDKTNKTITTFSKKGALINQSFISVTEDIVDFEVNTDTEKITILTTENLYET